MKKGDEGARQLLTFADLGFYLIKLRWISTYWEKIQDMGGFPGKKNMIILINMLFDLKDVSENLKYPNVKMLYYLI